MSLAISSCRVRAHIARTPTRCVPAPTSTAAPKRSVAAADGVQFEINTVRLLSTGSSSPEPASFATLARNTDLVPAVASALFLAVKKGVLAFSTEQLRVVLAIAVLTLPVVNVLIQKQNYDWVWLLLLSALCIGRVSFPFLYVSSSLAPSALAAEVLNILPAVPAAVVAFGAKLCSDLAGTVSINGAFYGFLATLAAAVYLSKAAVWFCGGWALLYGAKFVTALKDDTKVLIIPGIFSALLVAALVDFIKSKSMTMLTEVTVCIIAAQVAWSIFQTARNFANEASA